MHGFVFHWITEYGYFGLAGLLMLGVVGLPVPDETLLMFAGYLVYKGQFNLLATLAAAIPGSAVGITLSYALGRLAGFELVHHFGRFLHFDQKELDRTRAWFDRHGKWALTFGYFIPGVRHFTALVAGASRLEIPIFAAFAYAGAVLWCTSFILAGRILGKEWATVGRAIRHHLSLAAAVVAVAVLVYWLIRIRKS